MNELIQLTFDKKIKKNPKKIADMIVDLSKEIKECKEDLSQIKERGFFKKLFTNNVRDLSEVMIKQNDSISLFLNIVQSLIFLNMNNLIVIAGIQKALFKHEEKDSLKENEYYNIACEYIETAVDSARKTVDKLDAQESDIGNIKEKLLQKKRIDDEQNKLINDICQRFGEKKLLDDKQTQEIEHLHKDIESRQNTDAEQDIKIFQIIKVLKEKDKLDSNQSGEIEKITEVIKGNMEKLDRLENRINILSSDTLISKLTFDKKNKFLFIFSIVNVILFIILLILQLIRLK